MIVRQQQKRIGRRRLVNIDDLFPHKVCINLDRRADRWERIRERFATSGINSVARFPALDAVALTPPPGWTDEPGAYGCLRSHLAVVEEARRRNAPSVLIFEDDAVFDPEFAVKLPHYARQLPADWDMVLLGGIHGAQPVAVADNVVRITHVLSTFAYALRDTIYDDFIALNAKALTAVDDNNRILQKRFNCYCFMPHLAWVEEDYSDVRNKKLSHWWVKESLVLWGDEMEQILNSTALIIAPRDLGAAHVRNLQFVVNYYSEKLPGVAILAVEQGDEPRLNSDALPHGCRYEFLKGEKYSGDGAAFRLGFETFEAHRQFFMFADGNLFLERDDVKAALMKCLHHDFVNPFREVCDLSAQDTLDLIATGSPWNADAADSPRARSDATDSCSIFTRAGLQKVGGWGGAGESGTLLKAKQTLRAFESPGRAWRMSDD
jgi:hypothetical protein